MTKIDTLLELYSDELRAILDAPLDISEPFYEALNKNLAYLKNISTDIDNARREAAAFHSRILSANTYHKELGSKEQHFDPELFRAHSELEVALDNYVKINIAKRDVLYGRR